MTLVEQVREALNKKGNIESHEKSELICNLVAALESLDRIEQYKKMIPEVSIIANQAIADLKKEIGIE